MKVYDDLPSIIAPYITITCKNGFASSVVNTDKHSFRISHKGSRVIDSESWWQEDRRGIVLGGSFVFGVGATHDGATIPSILNSLTDCSWLNLGVRAANSIQELIAAIPFIRDSHLIVVCSGLNTLAAGLQTTGKNDLFRPLFAEELVEELARHPLTDLAAVVTANLGKMSGRILLTDLVGRAKRRVFAGRKAVPLRRHEMSEVNREAPGGLVAAALQRQERDLRMIVHALSPQTKLIFAIQPFAGTAYKVPSAEEERLFNIGDDLQGSEWAILKGRMTELWPGYVFELRQICSRTGVTCIDLNEQHYDGWIYVDRVHMTDTGYLQVAKTITAELSACAC